MLHLYWRSILLSVENRSLDPVLSCADSIFAEYGVRHSAQIYMVQEDNTKTASETLTVFLNHCALHSSQYRARTTAPGKKPRHQHG